MSLLNIGFGIFILCLIAFAVVLSGIVIGAIVLERRRRKVRQESTKSVVKKFEPLTKEEKSFIEEYYKDNS